MTAAQSSHLLDRYTEIGALCANVRLVIKRFLMPLAGILSLESLYLALSGHPGATAFALMSLGSCLVLAVWSKGGIGLPLLPVMAIQNLLIYGVPIAAGHDIITSYPEEFVLNAGIEVLIFNVAMMLSWRVGMQMFRPSAPVSYSLHEFNRNGIKGWARLGFGMIVVATGFEVLQGLSLIDPLYAMLPSGVTSIMYALVAVVTACGFFLVSMIVGAKEATLVERVVFWVLLVANGMISASDFLLASAAANFITVAIGFFWSSGKLPWRYLTIVMVVLSFLNTGKTNMRERYWKNEDTDAIPVAFSQLPAVYAEWTEVSFNAMVQNSSEPAFGARDPAYRAVKNQTLLDRIDNLQNLLFVMNAVTSDHVTLLQGRTYSLIPPLLVPRILWPDKPRSHEGQVMLNVHFGRQDLNSTFETYIAWGLLPEAYGNFGRYAGSIVLGCVLGWLFAWIENLTVRKLVVSMEGFLSLSLLMSLMNSFEMVASVLVTSTFQSFMIVILASLPFVHRTVAKPPPEDKE